MFPFQIFWPSICRWETSQDRDICQKKFDKKSKKHGLGMVKNKLMRANWFYARTISKYNIFDKPNV